MGYHSLRRGRHDSADCAPLSRLPDKEQSRNAYALGCLLLDEEGLPVAGKRIAFNPAIGRAALTHALAAYPWIALVLDLRLGGLDADGPTLSLASIHYRCLKSSGLRYVLCPRYQAAATYWCSLGRPCLLAAPVISTVGAGCSVSRDQLIAAASRSRQSSHCL